MQEFEYDVSTKDKCWYKNICDKSRCGDNFCIRHYKMSCLTHMATLEGKECYPIPLRLDSDGTDRDAYNQLKSIQQDISTFVTNGNNLLIYSTICGNGKTVWARKLLLSWFDSIWATTDFECRGLFISLPRLMTALKNNISKPDEYFQYIDENILNADLIVWDELNYKDMSGFEHDYLLNVLDRRISTGKANIFTGNFSLDIIERKLGSRLCSRIVGSSIKVELKGKDKRNWGTM